METESKILKMNEQIERIQGCIRFDKGSGNFSPTPAFVEAVDAITEDLKTQYHGYMPQQGFLELREQICDLDFQTGGDRVTTEQVLITGGAMHGISLALESLCNPRDEVLVHNIYFEGFANILRLHGLQMKMCNFYNTVSIGKAISKNTKAIILNSPDNPTGKVYSNEEIKSLAKVVRQNHLWVISDDVNNQLIYEGMVWENIRNYIPDQTITVNSFSKNYFLQGLRIGWAVTPKKLTKELTVRLANQTVCVNRFGQLVANEMLKRLPDKKVPPSYVGILEKRRNAMAEALQKEGFEVKTPQGGTNFFLNVGVSSELFAEQLLEKHKVAVVPGVYFGTQGENHVRLGFGSVTTEDIERGCHSIGETRRDFGG